MRLWGSEQPKHAISTLECTLASLGLRLVCCRGRKMQGWHQHKAHTTRSKHIHMHTHTHTYRQTYRHTQTPQNSRLWQIMIRSADGCKRFLLIFLFLGQLLTAAFSDAANLLCELLTFLHRSKAQRDGDECAPAVVRADWRVYRWLLLEWACWCQAGWWRLMWLETR